jgi:hypothetical protein
MATVITISQSPHPSAQLSLVGSQPPKWGVEFLDRRMREHRTWQNRELEDLTCEIFREVLDYTGQKLQQVAARVR